MDPIRRLLDRRTALLRAMNEITAKVDVEKRSAMTEDESKDFEAHEAELAQVNKEIARREKVRVSTRRIYRRAPTSKL